LHAKPGQINALEESSLTNAEQQFAPVKHSQSTSEHQKYAICMQQLPDELRNIVLVWPDLPDAVRAGILAMVRAVTSQ